jgi:MSHA biogenesis protein MshP
MNRRPLKTNASGGFSIVSAMFLLVALSAMGGFILTISTSQHVGLAQDTQGARARQAALAGLELGRYHAIVNNKCMPFTPALKDDLAPFRVSVQCSIYRSEDMPGGHIWSFTATAKTGQVATVGYVEHTVKATISR